MKRHARRAPGDEKSQSSPAVQRAGARWGIDRVLLLHGPPGGDDSDLARQLQRHLRHLPVVMLHDRLLPGARVVEHLAIGPGGVTVIADAQLEGPPQVERLHGMFGARAELLCDGAAADRGALLATARERVVAMRSIVAGAAPVEGAICLHDAGAAEPLRPLEVEGILVAGPRAVAAHAARNGDLADTALAALVDRVNRGCPPVLG